MRVELVDLDTNEPEHVVVTQQPKAVHLAPELA